MDAAFFGRPARRDGSRPGATDLWGPYLGAFSGAYSSPLLAASARPVIIRSRLACSRFRTIIGIGKFLHVSVADVAFLTLPPPSVACTSRTQFRFKQRIRRAQFPFLGHRFTLFECRSTRAVPWGRSPARRFQERERLRLSPVSGLDRSYWSRACAGACSYSPEAYCIAAPFWGYRDCWFPFCTPKKEGGRSPRSILTGCWRDRGRGRRFSPASAQTPATTLRPKRAPYRSGSAHRRHQPQSRRTD